MYNSLRLMCYARIHTSLKQHRNTMRYDPYDALRCIGDYVKWWSTCSNNIQFKNGLECK